MSIYDLITIGPLAFKPTRVDHDHVQVELEPTSGTNEDAPYVQDGAVYIPVKTWEGMQEASKSDLDKQIAAGE